MNGDKIISKCLKNYETALNEASEANKVLHDLLENKIELEIAKQLINKKKFVNTNYILDEILDKKINGKARHPNINFNDINEVAKYCLNYNPELFEDRTLDLAAEINAIKNVVKGHVLYVGGFYDTMFVKYWPKNSFTYISPEYTDDDLEQKTKNLEMIKGLVNIEDNECLIYQDKKFLSKLPKSDTIIIKCAASDQVYDCMVKTMKPSVIIDFNSNLSFINDGYKNISLEIPKLKKLSDLNNKLENLVNSWTLRKLNVWIN